jgi:hypothetical protein
LKKESSIKTKDSSKREKQPQQKAADKRGKHENESNYQRKIGKQTKIKNDWQKKEASKNEKSLKKR